MWQELPLSRGDRFPRWSRYGQMLKMLHRVEIEPAITRYLFFLRGCDWALPKSFVPTPCRHTRSDRENQPPIFRLPPWRIYITMLVWSILLDSRRFILHELWIILLSPTLFIFHRESSFVKISPLLKNIIILQNIRLFVPPLFISFISRKFGEY